MPIKPDGDVALFTGLLAYLAEQGAIDRNYVEAHTTGLAETLRAARTLSLERIAEQTGLRPPPSRRSIVCSRDTMKVVTVFSQGVNQSSQGTDKVNAIINCHLATGRIGRPGAGPFSVTGQPNAMGGREVGGLANMLAAHMEIENPAHRDRVQRFWNSPRIAARPGLKAVDMFRAVADGRIKALWIMATNPVNSMPDADRVEQALRTCPFVVVSDGCARPTRSAMPMWSCRRPAWGGKGWHGHQFGAPHLPSAPVSRLPRRGAAGLVDRLAGGEAHGLRPSLRLPVGRRDFRRARRALGLRK